MKKQPRSRQPFGDGPDASGSRKGRRKRESPETTGTFSTQPSEAGSSRPPPPRPRSSKPSAPQKTDVPPTSDLFASPASEPFRSGIGQATPIGAVLDSRYEIRSVLGEGSMGTVYLCRHTVMGKDVAVKILHRELAHDNAAVARFVTEAKAASAIGSEHIVGTLDFGTLPDGSAYFTMEYLEGRTLGERLEVEPLLPFDDILNIARQVVSGLDAAHLAGVVHRDLKPDNLFLTHRGSQPNFVKILDFGIAKIASLESDMTRAGAVFGTPHYMSPEQASGRPTDVRSDIYSLGVILYELAAGEVPFRGETALSVLSMHTNAPLVPLGERVPSGRTLPPGFEALVHRCLEKDPSERYQEMGELLFDLEQLMRGEPNERASNERTARAAAGEASARAMLAQRQGDASAPTKPRKALFAASIGAALLLVGLALGRLLSPSPAAAPEAAPPEAAVEPRNEANEPTPSAPAQTPELGEPAKAEGSKAEPTLPETAELAAAEALEPEVPKSHTDTSAKTGKVDLILFPLDAHAFRGKTDLGPMPLSVPVKKGEVVEIWVKRTGYLPRRILLRDNQTRRVVGLRATREWLEKAERLKAKRAGKAKGATGTAGPENTAGAKDSETPPPGTTVGEQLIP